MVAKRGEHATGIPLEPLLRESCGSQGSFRLQATPDFVRRIVAGVKQFSLTISKKRLL